MMRAGPFFTCVHRPGRWLTVAAAFLVVVATRPCHAGADRQPADSWTGGSDLARAVEKATRTGSADDAFAAGQQAARSEGFTFDHGNIANYQLAAEWFEKAALKGHMEAAFQMGELLFRGRLRNHDPACLPWYVKAAENGHLGAARCLGEALSEGHGRIVRDLAGATRWFSVAAEAGGTDVAYRLGMLLLDPQNPKHDVVAAKTWLRRASAAGDVNASARLMLMEGGSDVLSKTSLAEMEVAAEQWSSKEAHFIMGHAYLSGRVVGKDPEKALGHFGRVVALSWRSDPQKTDRDTASKDRDMLQESAAQMVAIYASGDLRRPSRTTAENPLPIEPAYVVSPEARVRLGDLFWEGNDLVTQDPQQAVEWYTRAAIAGSPVAMRRLSRLWDRGINGSADVAESLRWERRAALAEAAGHGDKPAPERSSRP